MSFGSFFAPKMVSRRPGRYLKSFLEPVAPSWLNISPWRAILTTFVPKMIDNVVKITVLVTNNRCIGDQ